MEVFISYTRTDQDQLLPLVKLLEDGGYEVWYDSRRLVAGTEWDTAIRSAIQTCNVVLFLITPESIHSEWCTWEITEAQRLGKPVVPVVLEPTELPPHLQKIHFVDLSEGYTANAAVKLMRALQLVTRPQQLRADAAPTLPVAALTRPNSSTTELGKFIKVIESAVREAFTESEFTHFFANPVRLQHTQFRDRWSAILNADVCVYDLTGGDAATLVELGIGIALSKPMILMAKEDAPIPDFICPADPLYYADEIDLQVQLAERIADHVFRGNLRQRKFCYFCDMVACEALARSHDPNKCMVISDESLLRSNEVRQMEKYIRKKLNDVEIIHTVKIQYNDVCELHQAVRTNQFVICNLEEAKTPLNLLALGLALGSLTPWFLVYRDNASLPSTLRTLDMIDYDDPDYSQPLLLERLDRFLGTVYPQLVTSADVTHTSMVTRPEKMWESLQRLRAARTLKPSEAMLEDEAKEIQGDLLIIRIMNSPRPGGDLRLSPRSRTLIFGRKSETGVIQLASQSASRRHFKIEKRSDRYFVEDLDSTTGTFLNGERIPKQRPVEIFLNDVIVAGRSTFLIWDDVRERPTVTDGQLEYVKDFSDLSGTVHIVLDDIDPPADSQTLDQELVLHAVFATADETKSKPFQLQAYYPLARALPILVPTLMLPKITYRFMVGGLLVGPNDTALSLGLRDGDEVYIAPDPVEWSVNRAMSLIDHCVQSLVMRDGKLQFRSGFRYLRFNELVAEVFQRQYNRQLPPDAPMRSFLCPHCHNWIERTTRVAFKDLEP